MPLLHAPALPAFWIRRGAARKSTEFAAEDFAGDGFGEVGDDFDGAGIFLSGHAGFAEGDDLFRGDFGAGFEADDGFDGFA